MPSNIRKKYIGVFDSGFGGISALKGIIKKLPEYSYIYLGDSARTPYGTRSQETIYNFSQEAVEFLFNNNCQLIIFACNTASSKALRKLQKNYLRKKYPDKRVLGVLIPAIEEAARKTKNKKIGVIATEGSVRSLAFEKELKNIDKKIKVYQKACPLLVPLVESGEYKDKITNSILERYLRDLTKKEIDTLILGCTHYGLLKSKIRKITGSKINIISDEKVVPQKLADYLLRHPEIERSLKKNSDVKFYTTDLTEKFTKIGGKFFGRQIKARKITLR